jgi:DNA-directed RNA polymerase sigma subunit (sigma70/sigma32)
MDGPAPTGEQAGQALSEGLRQLTDRQRFVIDRYYGLTLGVRYSLHQLATLMGLDYSTVKEHYHAGMKRLEKLYPPS